MDQNGVWKISEAHIDPELEADPNLVPSIKLASPRHCHDFYEFFLITEGRCLHRVNGSEQTLCEGALVFIRPDDTHAYETVGAGDCQFINIACTRRVIGDVLAFLGGAQNFSALLASPMPPVAMLAVMERESFIEGYQNLRTLAMLSKKNASMLLRGMLAGLFTRYFPVSRKTEEEPMPPWLNALLTTMHRQENFTLGVERMAELSGRSVGHINRVFRRRLDTTPTAFINRVRLDFAKNLLMTTDLNILDIALESGYDNLSYFYRLFRRRFGVTPAGLRRAAADG